MSRCYSCMVSTKIIDTGYIFSHVFQNSSGLLHATFQHKADNKVYCTFSMGHHTNL